MVRAIELELQVDENGELRITREQLGQAQPGARFRISAEPIEEPSAQTSARWAAMSPQERAKDLRELARTFGSGPGLSDWAVSRDSIYD